MQENNFHEFLFSLVFKSLTSIFNKLWTLMPGRDAACPCCAFFFFYLFMGSVFEKATKYFPAPLRVSFRIFVKRKAKIGLQTLQT